jgi:DNA repair protein RecN (Recombination protein N)
MLKSLFLKDFALFENQEIEFSKGVTSLIGESGSGKSLILDALASILGGRCSTANIRSGKDRYSLQAVFDVSEHPEAKEWLKEHGFAIEDSLLSITREVQRDGKTRVFIGESLASLSLLKDLGTILCEMHNQNEQMFLLDRSNQLEFLDRFLGLSPLREEMRSAFRSYRMNKKKLDEWEERYRTRKLRMDSLRFQIQDLEAIAPKPGELEELVEEEKLLIHGEKLFENLKIVTDSLWDAEDSVGSKFPQILAASEKIGQIHSGFQETSKEIVEIWERIKDLKRSIRAEEEEIFFSPERLDRVQSRLRDLTRIPKKYNLSIEEVLQELDHWKKELVSLEQAETSAESIRNEYLRSLDRMKGMAMELSKKRRAGLAPFEENIQKELEFLGMKGARIQIVLRWEEDTEGELKEGEKSYLLNESGLDQAEYYFTANLGEKPRPLRKVASGGEMSRIMLAIRSVLGRSFASRKLVVFDEIDSGVGGEAAVSMANRLQKLGENTQILLVTHSQSIASVSENYWKIEKKVKDGRTFSVAKSLGKKEIPMELARLVSGREVTEAAIEHAKELLRKKAS